MTKLIPLRTLITAIFLISTLFSTAQKTNQDLRENNTVIIAQYLDHLGASDKFSGAVLIAKNDEVLFKKAYGLAHIGHKVQNNTKTKFNLGSIGKSFTAVAIMQLVQSGKLTLKSNVGEFLPDYPNPTIRDSVSIAHLLTHTSGVPHYFAQNAFLDGSKDRFRSLGDLASLYENEPMESKPGELFSYRNTNYILLGRIIEKITGQTYDDYLEASIYKPSNMTQTGNFDMDHPIENAAEGYTTSEIDPEQYKINTHTYPVKGGPHGGGYSTVMDLYNFSRALKDGLLLNEKYFKLFTTPINSNAHYGYGMQFSNPIEGTILGHSGGHFGVGTEWRIYKKEGYTVILLTNRDTDKGFLDARYFIQKMLSGTTPSIEKYFNTKAIISTYEKVGYLAALDLLRVTEEDLSEMDFTMRGYDWIKKRDYKKAIDVFRLGVVAFPESSDMLDSLGEAYMHQGDRRASIENYEKSIELNPKNQNGTDMLKKLKSL